MRKSETLKGVTSCVTVGSDEARSLRNAPTKEAEMPTDFEELKRSLLQTDEEFRQLATKHHDLDEKLHNYATRYYLTDPEQIEEVTLKKQKLHLKDQMESILRRYGTVHEPASARS
jgi:uncharacterized protein YdcH (DUF465 family)